MTGKAIGANIAASYIDSLVKWSGLERQMVSLAGRVKLINLALPFAFPQVCLEVLVEKVFPPILYHTKVPPFFTKDVRSSMNFTKCTKIQKSPPLYRCRLDYGVLLAGFSEEGMFRGVLQQKVLPRIANLFPSSIGNVLKNKITRILLSSLIFAAAHPSDNFSGPFSLGIVNGLIAESNQSLKLPILTHLLNNSFIALVYAGIHAYGKEMHN